MQFVRQRGLAATCLRHNAQHELVRVLLTLQVFVPTMQRTCMGGDPGGAICEETVAEKHHKVGDGGRLGKSDRSRLRQAWVAGRTLA